jgi:transketolase
MRPKTPILYGTNDTFTVGGSRVLRSSGRDRVTIVAAGITVHEALAAHERLASENIAVRVIDLYSVKPLDRETLLEAARETGAVVTAEDHRAEGGLGEAVAAELAGECPVRTLAVRGMPRSGTKEQLLAAFGIDAAGIAAAVRDVLTKRRRSTSRGGGQAP